METSNQLTQNVLEKLEAKTNDENRWILDYIKESFKVSELFKQKNKQFPLMRKFIQNSINEIIVQCAICIDDDITLKTIQEIAEITDSDEEEA